MGLLKSFTSYFVGGKTPTTTLDNPKSQLTENQTKTIAVLRDLAKKNRPKRIQMIKEYKDFLKKKAEEPPALPPDKREKPKKKIAGSFPITVSKDDETFIKDIKKNRGAVKFTFSNGLKSGSKLGYIDSRDQSHVLGEVLVEREPKEGAIGFGKFGMRFEKKDNQFNLIIRYPISPNVLRSLSQINQGDLTYRMRSMSSSKTNNNDNKSKDLNPSSKINELVDDIFSPSKNEDFKLLSDSSIDNVAWYDFATYQYIKEPVFLEQGDGPILIGPQQAPDGLLFDEFSDLFILIENSGSGGADSGETSNFIRVLREEFSLVMKIEIDNYFEFIGYSTVDMQGASIPENLADSASHRIISALKADYEVLATITEIFWALPAPDISNQRKLFAQWLALEFPDRFSSRGEYYNAVRLDSSVIHEVELFFRWVQLKTEALEYWGEYANIPALEGQDEMQDNALLAYPFELYQPNTWNLGLRLVYRQEWRPLGNQRGEIVKTIPLGPKQIEKISTKIVRRTKVAKTSENLKSTETTTETSDTTKDSSEIINEAASSRDWEIKADGSLNIGGFGGTVQGPSYRGASSDTSKETSAHLSEIMQKTASKIKTETKLIVSTESESTFEVTTASEIQNPNEEIALTYVYSKLQLQYEIFTSLVEVQNVVMIAEHVPKPNEINNSWIKKHDWIIAKVILDDSFRDALASISQEVSTNEMPIDKIDTMMDNAKTGMATLANMMGSASLSNVDVIQEAQRAYRETYKENYEKRRNRILLEEKQQRLRQHIRENILHYCRAIWSQEDPQQRLLRYRKRNIRIPTQWIFVGTFGGQQFSMLRPDWPIDELLEQVQLYEIDDDGNTVFDMDGMFHEVGTEDVDFADLINPAGPIGYHGNYAIYYMRPEYASDNMFDMLDIVKTPYLYYEKGDPDNPTLIDPYFKRLIIENEGKGPGDVDEKMEMSQYVPELRLLYTIAKRKDEDAKDENASKEFFDDEELFKKHYPEFLFRKEQSRRFLLETNNLTIDILPGDGSALEAFKLAHRGIDVLKAVEEKDKMKLENERRQKLIDEDKLGDPDIEKVTIVTGENNQLGSLIAGVVEGSSDSESEQ